MAKHGSVGALKLASLALLAGMAGCSDDAARMGLTTASLGIEPSNQDRIIRKVGASGAVRAGVRPPDAPEQSYPDDAASSRAAAVETTIEPPVSHAAPQVASVEMTPLEPNRAASVAAPVETAAIAVKRAAPTMRKITKAKLAAEGVPVVPPAPKAPGRLREIGEPLTVGSVKAARAPATRTANGDTHIVASGDSLYGLSRRYGVSVEALQSANGLSGSALSIGQRLVLPGGAVAATKPKVAPAQVAAAPKEDLVTGSIPRTGAAKTAPVVEKASVAPAPAPKSVSDAGKFAWPVRGKIVATFGQRTPAGPSRGLDIAVPEGTPIRAARDGVVLYSGSELKDLGNLVLVRHADGWVTAYANASENLVKRGDRVARGQTIARSGSTGKATRPQVHFELRRNSKPVDPQRHLAG